jgi:hypothetical protein
MWSEERYSVEHIRGSLAAVERRCNARAAVADPLEADAGADEVRSRAARFAASLPPAASRLQSLLLIAAILVVARVLFTVFGTLSGSLSLVSAAVQTPGGGPEGSKLADAAARVGDLSLGNISELAKLLLETSLLDTAYVVTIFGVATYLVLRPSACGAIAFRTALHGGGSSRRVGFYVPERRIAERVRLGEHEANVLSAVGIKPGPEPRIDFIAKACLAAPLLLLAAVNWSSFLQGWNLNSGNAEAYTYTLVERHRDDALRAIVIGVLVTLRLGWLWVAACQTRPRASRAPRNTRRPELVLAAVTLPAALLVLAASYGLYALWDHRAPSLWLRVPPLTTRDLHGSEFCNCAAVEVRYACDESCRLDGGPWLDGREFDTPPLPKHMSGGPFVELAGDRAVAPRERIDAHRVLEGSGGWWEGPLPTDETRATRVGYSKRQSDWIRRELVRRRTIPMWVRVQDDAGNSTSYVYDFRRARR